MKDEDYVIKPLVLFFLAMMLLALLKNYGGYTR